MAIDWSFISQEGIEGESEHLTGYVPTDTSGFTVGSFDLGQHSKEDIRSIMQSYQNKQNKTYPLAEDTELYKRISSYALNESIDDATAKQVKFTDDEVKYLTAAKRHSFEKSIHRSKGDAWKNLDEKTQTILGSIGWQYGTGKNKKTDRNIFEEFWKIRDNKAAIHKKLIDMSKNEYTFRRGKEADYILPPPPPVQEILNVNRKQEIFSQ